MSAMTPLLITGMHRSGTSLTARMLGECGVFLGPADKLAPPRPDNPDGFFEHIDVVAINDKLLEACDSGWDIPTSLPSGWQSTPLATRYRNDATGVLAELRAGAATGPWGWKDPRTCLTWPFWKDLLADCAVVVCLRNPIDVALSLHARGSHSLTAAFRLWATYYRGALALLESSPNSVVVHFDCLVADPVAELQRLIERLGLDPDAGSLTRALDCVKPTYRHHRQDLSTWLAHPGFGRLMPLYRSLGALAGPAFVESAESKSVADYCRHAAAAEPRHYRQSGDGAAPTSPEAMPWMARIAELEASVGVLQGQLIALRGEHEHEFAKPAVYRCGAAIDFSLGGNAPLYCRTGWHAPEIAGTWTAGTVAELLLQPLAPMAATWSIRMTLRIALDTGLSAQQVALEISGQEVGKWRFGESGWATVRAVVSGDLVGAGEPIRLRVISQGTFVPALAGPSDDQRRLGVLVRSMTLGDDAGTPGASFPEEEAPCRA